MLTRIHIVFEARSWLNTMYKSEGRVKGREADCLYILAVAEKLGIKDKFGIPLLATDYKGYSNQPKDAFIYEEAKKRLVAKPVHLLKRGDLVVTRFGSSVASHCAIVGDFTSVNYNTLTLIHCNGRKIVEVGLEMTWRRRIIGAFEFPEAC